MKLLEQIGYVIMNKDRSIIATGVPRNRKLEKVKDLKHCTRILTYRTENYAKAGFTGFGFWYQRLSKDGFRNYEDKLSDYLEPVKIKMTLMEES